MAIFQHNPHIPSQFPSTSPDDSVKSESTSLTPDLPPSATSLAQFQFQFRPQSLQMADDGNLQFRLASPTNPCPDPSVYRFGGESHYPQVVPSSSSSSGYQQQHSAAVHSVTPPLEGLQQTTSFLDDYDDVTEMDQVPDGTTLGHGDENLSDKTVRRRSSKACDQCRKCKCKCERIAPGKPCRSCVALGTACTFLGPTRKRGPPKGYIDAIEARLHQTEALLGVLIDSKDERAKGLFSDLAKDPLAKEIINRVENSPYGATGRKRYEAAAGSKTKSHSNATSSGSGVYSFAVGSSPASGSQTPGEGIDIVNVHPSNEWQNRVSTMLHGISPSRDSPSDEFRELRYPPLKQPVLHVLPESVTVNDESQGQGSPVRRLRRKLDSFSREHSQAGFQHSPQGFSPSTDTSPTASRSPVNYTTRTRSLSGQESLSGSDSEEELTDAVGQLSLNEEAQLRYHGKASGLHLLGVEESVDGRNEGGIWRFPKARVWPPLPGSKFGTANLTEDEEFARQLPEKKIQEHLLEVYFAHVHPALPLIHKKAFFEIFRNGNVLPQSPLSASSDIASNASTKSVSPFNRQPRHIPTLLLLAMFAIASRYAGRNPSTPPPPPDGSMMWSAGDEYLDTAKIILDRSYASSRASTCQALLLMGYREIGIGAMAQAWTYIGMAVRMAQDLGMHRSADGWARESVGKLFSEWELHERKRIWYACVIMDKYVSTYIGRPLSIFDRDFDTPLPSESDSEELEGWTPHPSFPVVAETAWEAKPKSENLSSPVPGRIITCFNAAATLSGILSQILQAIYSVHPSRHGRHSEAVRLEAHLDKWYFELPEHLRHEPGSMRLPVPLPHVLTLHMQYWCTVLLLYRPFIRQIGAQRRKSNPESPDEAPVRGITEKSYELCASAANHITSILSLYMEHYCMKRTSVFLCYYVFTASIMHVTTLTTYPAEPQATMGLAKCMEALQKMEIVWPSAGRALELLRESKVNLEEAELARLSNHPDRNKRSAEQPLDDSFERDQLTNTPSQYCNLRSQIYGSAGYSAPDVYGMHRYHGSSSLTSLPYFSTPEGWSTNSPNPTFPATLSTSVLPQIYSTGLGDGRGPSLMHGHGHLQPAAETSDQSRLPQFWNDYSSFSQLGSASHGTPAQNQLIHQSNNLAEHYNIYGGGYLQGGS